MALRSLLFALTLAFGLQATGAAELLAGTCSAPCDDDDDEGRCPPTCACTPRLNAPVRVSLDVTPPTPTLLEVRAPLVTTAASPTDGFAEEILHVPIFAGPAPLLS